MGLIQAGIGALGGVLADQWKEFIVCDSMPENVLVRKGQKRTSSQGRSSNTTAEDNVISNGSGIVVADGQCMIIVENGKVVDICAEPGQYTYKTDLEPSIFVNGFNKEGIMTVFQQIGKRFQYGGDPGKDQRVYYFNIKELVGNKYGTPSAVPFRVVDNRIGLDLDIAVRCFGEYSYKLVNPILFYTNICGNITEDYTRDRIEGQLKTELMTALQPAFAKISELGIRYSAVPAHTEELSEALNEVLSKKWSQLRGIEIVSFGVSSIKANEEDENMIKEIQRNAALRDPNMAAAHLAGATAAAMQGAANNPNGAMAGFMGMGMAQGVAGGNIGNLFAMGQQQAPQQPQYAAPQAQAPAPAAAPAAAGWTCACGQTGNTGKFCAECGAPKPAPVGEWTCSCGTVNKGKFCAECGSPRPAADWTCPNCGETGIKGKFCPECGAKRP